MNNEMFFPIAISRQARINIIDKGILMLYCGVEIFLLEMFETCLDKYDHRSNKWFTLNKHPFIMLSRQYGDIFFG